MKLLQKCLSSSPQHTTTSRPAHHYAPPTTTIISLHTGVSMLAGSQIHNQKGDEGDYAKEPLPNNGGKGSSDVIWNE